jgi:hypothetical protein
VKLIPNAVHWTASRRVRNKWVAIGGACSV